MESSPVMLSRSESTSSAATANYEDARPAAAARGGIHISESTRRWAYAIVDQGLVSGTRFLTTIIIGRAAGPDELGHYSIALTALVLFGCLQEALVTTPYAVHFHEIGRRARSAYAGGSWMLHLLLASCGALAMLAFAFVIWALGSDPQLVPWALVVAATIPVSLMWEFARRSLLAQLNVVSATFLDASVATTQLLGLVLLAVSHRLTACTALMVIAASFLVITLDWLRRTRATRLVRWNLLGHYWKRNWKLGRWLVASQIVGALHAMIPGLMLAMLIGTTATGVFTAHLNIAILASPLILAVCNLLTARASHVLADDGPLAVLRLVKQASWWMFGILGLYELALAIMGEQVVLWIYGSAYAGHYSTLMVLGLCPITWGISGAYSCGLSALRYPRGGFVSSGIGICISIITTLIMVGSWGELGAAVGLLTGCSVATLLHMAYFYGQLRGLLQPVSPAPQVCPSE